jgi:pimeloyl-ACP methyl ester carboxylesterase
MNVRASISRVRALKALAVLAVASCALGQNVVAQREAASGSGTASSGAVTPFKIRVPEPVLADLKRRLQQTRFPDEIPMSGWDFGTNLGYLKQLVTYWRDGFDWREQERRLNQLPQFKTNIDGLDVHFVHQRSSHRDALPLVLVHGWPGSFIEFTKILGPLTEPTAHGGQAADAFHVVAVSLPGYGFSGKPRERGYGPMKMAAGVAKVMERLGYTRYGAQGGDWGAAITRWVAINDAQHVVGLHSNFCNAGPPPGVADPTAGVPPSELERMRSRQAFFDNERGYFLIQSTRPQTLGYGLNDSPVGLAAWILEKFRSWCDCEGDVERKFSKDLLLTNIMTYWVTETITSSTRIYFENQQATALPGRVTVPTACAVFPKEIVLPPRRWVEARDNVTRWTEMPRGGHFAALEQPELLVDDIRAFFRTLR